MRSKEPCTPILKVALGVVLSPEIAAEEEAATAQASSRARDYARGWLRADMGGVCARVRIMRRIRYTKCAFVRIRAYTLYSILYTLYSIRAWRSRIYAAQIRSPLKNPTRKIRVA
jgi:hypothetical protein